MTTFKDHLVNIKSIDIKQRHIEKILLNYTGSIYEMYKDIKARTDYNYSFVVFLIDIQNIADKRGLK